MKTAIKLICIYFLLQCGSAMLLTFISMLSGHALSDGDTGSMVLLLACLFMGLYLYKKGYLKDDGNCYTLTSPGVVAWAVVALGALIFLEDFLLSHLRFLPNFLEEEFGAMQSGWIGILAIALVGPLLEELLFRGAITRELLCRYSPKKAILLSALLFGVFHLNPVQVVGATLIGLLLAWLYWRTRSIVPGLVLHILNNSLSLYLSHRYAGVDYFSDILPAATYYVCLAVALLALPVALRMLARKTTLA